MFAAPQYNMGVTGIEDGIIEILLIEAIKVLLHYMRSKCRQMHNLHQFLKLA